MPTSASSDIDPSTARANSVNSTSGELSIFRNYQYCCLLIVHNQSSRTFAEMRRVSSVSSSSSISLVRTVGISSNSFRTKSNASSSSSSSSRTAKTTNQTCPVTSKVELHTFSDRTFNSIVLIIDSPRCKHYKS